MPEVVGEVTVLLRAWQAGDQAALARLTPLLYSELRQLAESYMRRERPGHTLQPTALVHEAFARLCGAAGPIEDRRHFLALSARNMRQILVAHARRRTAGKRAGGQPIVFDETMFAEEHSDTLVALDESLAELEKMDPRKAHVIEMVYFGGMSQHEIADHVGVSIPTVAREMRAGLAWLKQHL